MVRQGIATPGPRNAAVFAVRSLCALAVLASALLAQAAGAQDPITVSIVDVDGPSEGVVRVVLAADQAGRPVGDLAPEDVSVTVDGRAVDLASLSLQTDATVPIDVVLALDVSGSMAGETMSAAQAAAAALVRALGPSDRGAVVTFGGVVVVAQPPTDSKPALEASIAELVAGGDTALFDGVAESARVSASFAGQRRAVIVLSDGEDFGGRSVATRDQAIAAAVASDAVYYTVGVGGFFDRSFLQDLAGATGGRFLEAGGAGDLPPLYEVLSSLLKGRHVITFERPGATADQVVRITVSTADSSGSVEFTLAAPPPPATPTPTRVTTAVATPTPAAEVAPGNSGGGSTLTTIVAAATAGTLAVAAGAIILRRRRAGPVPWNPSEPLDAATSVPAPAGASEPAAWGGVFRVSGPSLPAMEVSVGPGPAEIGSGEDCDIVLPADDVASVHVRIWGRDGRTMLHHVGRTGTTRVNGQAVEWASLVPGDTLAIGAFVLTYRE